MWSLTHIASQQEVRVFVSVLWCGGWNPVPPPASETSTLPLSHILALSKEQEAKWYYCLALKGLMDKERWGDQKSRGE